MEVLFYLTKPHLLWPSNFRIMVSMKIFGGATCPLLTGILKAPRVQSLNPAAQLNVFLYPMVARFWIMYIYFSSLTNHDQSARAFCTHSHAHTFTRKSRCWQYHPNVFTKCKNVRKKKIEPYKACTTATFSLQISALLSPPSGVLSRELRHVIPSQRGREGEIEPWVSVPYDFNVWSLPGRYI